MDNSTIGGKIKGKLKIVQSAWIQSVIAIVSFGFGVVSFYDARTAEEKEAIAVHRADSIQKVLNDAIVNSIKGFQKSSDSISLEQLGEMKKSSVREIEATLPDIVTLNSEVEFVSNTTDSYQGKFNINFKNIGKSEARNVRIECVLLNRNLPSKMTATYSIPMIEPEVSVVKLFKYEFTTLPQGEFFFVINLNYSNSDNTGKVVKKKNFFKLVENQLVECTSDQLESIGTL